ncbi:MAG: response regulator [Okeania sp. SIO3B5]|uniref:response regulator n=1 Tax=Okeania sp. SIO3B5 TaxID=2607811 RepID=UPI0013FEC184|nr:response regulator [Okeania sp. SIO3B5]NEO55071.1 response regulator [Okeania sp. SIO3B5]
MVLRILIVDDNRDTLKRYVKSLKRRLRLESFNFGTTQDLDSKSPIEIEECDSVIAALKKLRNQPFEILIVDLKIPGSSGEEMGGLELIDESVDLDPLRPIIVITGYANVELARRTLTKGVFDFIEKSATAIEDLVSAVQRAIDTRNEKIRRVGNPFTPMTGLEPTVFGGRTQELQFFEDKLNRAIYSKYREHFLILGDWGIGKSTLLREYKKICQSRGYISCIVPIEPIQKDTGLLEVTRIIIEGILHDLPYPVDRFKKVLEFFNSLEIKILGTGVKFERSNNNNQEIISPKAFLRDTLSKLWEDIEDKTDVFVILLDDLENLAAVPEILMTLKSALTDSLMETKILVGLASTSTNWVEITSVQKHHPVSRYFLSRVELTSLTEKEVKETIRESLAGTGVSFSQEVMQNILKYSGGHPFEMQLLCYHLFSNHLSRYVEIDIWEKALQATVRDVGNAIFEKWCSDLSVDEAKVLRILAGNDNSVTLEKLTATFEVENLMIPMKYSVEEVLKSLLQRKLIDRDIYGNYVVKDRMFCTYLITHLNYPLV